MYIMQLTFLESFDSFYTHAATGYTYISSEGYRITLGLDINTVVAH